MTTLIPKFEQTGSTINRPISAKLQEIQTTADYTTWGSRCVAVGGNNIPIASTGIENIVLGYGNLIANTTGFANIAIGTDVLAHNTTGGYNVSTGALASTLNTTGSSNCAYGVYSLYANKTGNGNCGFGEDTNRYLDSGSNNVAAGVQSLYNNVSGGYNTALGAYAARGVANPPDLGPGVGPNPTYLVAVGTNSLYTAAGTENTGVGYGAGYLTTGSYNSYFGSGSGYQIVAGAYNVFVGYQAGGNASQLSSATNCVAIGDGAYTTGNNAVAIGSGVIATANNVVLGNTSHTYVRPSGDNQQNLGSASNRWATVFAATGTINTSDATQKQQFATLTDAEQATAKAIKGLIKTFKFNDAVTKKGDKARKHIGVSAQDVQAVFIANGLNADEYGLFCSDTLEDGSVRLGIRYDELLAFIIAAL